MRFEEMEVGQEVIREGTDFFRVNKSAEGYRVYDPRKYVPAVYGTPAGYRILRGRRATPVEAWLWQAWLDAIFFMPPEQRQRYLDLCEGKKAKRG